MQSYVWLIGALTALAATAQGATTQTQPTTPSATQLALDMYHGCLKDLSISCVRPKALQWFNAALQQNEVRLTDRLSVVRTAQQQPEASSTTGRALNAEQHQQQLFDRIDSYLASHALRIQAPEYFRSSEARALVPDYLLQNPLTQGGLIPLGAANEGKSDPSRSFNLLTHTHTLPQDVA